MILDFISCIWGFHFIFVSSAINCILFTQHLYVCYKWMMVIGVVHSILTDFSLSGYNVVLPWLNTLRLGGVMGEVLNREFWGDMMHVAFGPSIEFLVGEPLKFFILSDTSISYAQDVNSSIILGLSLNKMSKSFLLTWEEHAPQLGIYIFIIINH